MLFVLLDLLRELRPPSCSSVVDSSFLEDRCLLALLEEPECDRSERWRWSPLFLVFRLLLSDLSSSLPRKLPFRRIPFTAFDVDICLLERRAELPGTKLPPGFGSSNTTEVRLTPLDASLEAVSETEPPSRSMELTERLDSVLCMLLFWMAYFRKEEALGDSRFDFFSVLVVPSDGSSIEELLGRATFDKPSIPLPFPMQRALPLPVSEGRVGVR